MLPGWMTSVGSPGYRRSCGFVLAATEAVYGADSPNFLHSELHSRSWQPVLSALGVEGAPSRGQLVTRLKELRAAMQADEYPAPRGGEGGGCRVQSPRALASGSASAVGSQSGPSCDGSSRVGTD